ncbi:MAG: LysR family transcriptional regulator [Cellvibrionales bacterium]|nr:LysR family transcriptional regulator [Cellvibrionales bacterium]
MNLNDLPIFVKVAELQGISKAADALNLPKSKVSRRLTELEQSLGVRLLERNTRAVRLTDMGQALFIRAQKVLDEAELAKESVLSLKDEPEGVLRITTSLSLGQYLLAPIVAEFSLLYPKISVDLDLSNRRVDMIREGFDCAIRVGQLDDSQLVCQHLLQSSGAFFASEDYLKRFGVPMSFQALESHRLLTMRDQIGRKEWMAMNPEGKEERIRVKPTIEMNDFSSLKMAAEAGAGVILLPLMIAEQSLTSGKLVQVLPDYRLPSIDYYLLYPSVKGLPKKTRLFIEFVKAQINAGN